MNGLAEPAEQQGLLNLMKRLRDSGDWRGTWVATRIERALSLLGEVDGPDKGGWAEVDRFVRSGDRDGLAGFSHEKSPPVPAPGLGQMSEHEEARRLIWALVEQIDLVWMQGSRNKEGGALDGNTPAVDPQTN